MIKKIAVLLGGVSPERIVLIKSENAVLNSLIKSTLYVRPINTRDFPVTPLKKRLNAACISLHGKSRENSNSRSIKVLKNTFYRQWYYGFCSFN